MPYDDRELLRLYLAGREVGCPKCGYNLRDCPGTVCPECGNGLRLHLHPIVKLPTSYSIGVTGLACGLVLGGVAAFFGISKGPFGAVLGGLVGLTSIIALIVWDKVFFRTWRRRRAAVPYLVWGAWAGAIGAAMQIAWLVARLL